MCLLEKQISKGRAADALWRGEADQILRHALTSTSPFIVHDCSYSNIGKILRHESLKNGDGQHVLESYTDNFTVWIDKWKLISTWRDFISQKSMVQQYLCFDLSKQNVILCHIRRFSYQFWWNYPWISRICFGICVLRYANVLRILKFCVGSRKINFDG